MFRLASRSSRLRLAAALTIALAIALVGACGDPSGPPADATTVALPFRVGFTPQLNVTSVVVTVSGPRIDPPLVFNFPVVRDTAVGTMTLPVGTNRLIVAQAFDSTGLEVLRGQRTTAVAAGSNAAVVIVMSPLTGAVPVTAVIGNITVSLSAASATVRAGGTVALTAEVRDATNAVLNVPVLYAVSRPPAARVGSSGVLTALDTGSVVITATALGRSASTLLSVTAGTVLESVRFAPDSVIGSGSVEATIALLDNLGVDSVRVRTVSPTGATGPSCASTAPLRGTRTVGEFVCVLVVPTGAATGRWPVSAVEVHAGPNLAVLDSIALRHRGTAAAVRNVP